MEPWYPIVIGTVIFLYIHSFNRTAKLYLDSNKSLTFEDFFTKIIPIS